ncbi:sensor histidine kinase [Paenibacillus sp. S-38]|uniref:sensor histidine kinase n=1 Tax=Paenibacillus sp. S-38 TaxID=3416710 RepID=UPI003CEE918F
MGMNRLLHYFQNLRFKQKLFSSYLVVCIIPLLVLGAFSYYQASRFLLQQAEQNLGESIGGLAEGLDFRTRQFEAVINSVTQNIVFKQIFVHHNGNITGLYRDYVDPFFSNILDFNPDLLQISVFTDNPEILRGNYILPLELIHGMQWSRSLKQEGTQWMGYNGKVFATRLFADNDMATNTASSAVLFLSLDEDSLFQGLREIQADAYHVSIRDREGRTVTARSAAMPGDFQVPEGHAPGEPEAPGNSSGYLTVGQTEYLYLRKEIPGAGWELLYYTPKDAIAVDARSIVGATALIIAVCLIILVFLIRMFSNTFVNRITKLNTTMMLVENGNLKVEVSSPSRDEIGQLTNRFGRMLHNINTLIEEVYQSKITQREAELKALQTQINPHFLYNTLSIINWKALQADALEISEITTNVSKFYRTVLNKGRNIIRVRHELENAKAYMQIQLVMHSHSFDFHCEVEEQVLEFDTINLIFQPILENALEHGIDRIRKGERRGRIAMRGFLEGERVTFTIEDNGPGMDAVTAREVLIASSQGYGLKNVNDRLQLRFGADYGLSLQSALGQGTTVTLAFPRYTEGVSLPEDR